MADGTLEQFARHIVLALEPLREAVTDSDHFEAFMLRLGWTVRSFPQPYEDLRPLVEAAIDALESLAEDPDPEDVLALLSRVREVHRALTAIGVAPEGVAPAEVSTFLAELAERVVELLLAEHLRQELPAVYHLAAVSGIVTTEYRQATGTRPDFLRTTVRLDRLGDVLTDPGSAVSRLYGWTTPEFDFAAFADDLSALLWAFDIANRVEEVDAGLSEGYRAVPLERADKQIETRVRTRWFEVPPPAGSEVADSVGFSVLELPPEDGQPPGVILQPALPAAGGALALTEGWTLRLRPGTDPEDLFGVLIRPGSIRVRFPLAPGSQLPATGFGASLEYRPRDATLVLGSPDGSRVEFEGATFGLRIDLVNGQPVVTGDLRLENLAAVLTTTELDGFLAGLIGRDSVRIPISLGLTWSSTDGFGFALGAGLEVVRHPDLDLGPVTITTLLVAVRATTDALTVEVGVGFRGDVGPLTFTVEGLGIEGELAFEAGNAGPFDVGVGLRLPTGLGLGIEAGPVEGGGFLRFDSATGRYAGGLAVRLERLNVVGAGLLDTRVPGADFALVVLLSTRFQPGIPLGWGFELTGVGGLLAINRRLDVDALHERFATGAAGRLLAAEGTPNDLPAMLDELDALFPVADGVFVVGPTLRLIWVRLVTIDVGVFLEFPGPTRVVVLGTARARLDNPLAKGPLVQLRADFVGVLDLEKSTFAFDATLVDSRLLESFPLTGDILFRAGWGDEPYTVMSVGGFHPDFHPGNLPVPKTIDRLAMSYGDPGDRLYLRFEGYFAITSNSVQFGASVEVHAKLGPFRITGFIGFDAMIRFEPFFFSISFRAGVRLKWKGRTLAGITVKGTLSGPGPVKFQGRACVELLFFDLCKSGSFEIGSDAPPVVRPIPSALTMLALELRNPANLRAASEDRSVVLRDLPSDPPVLAPTGVIWEQTRAPLGLLLERFEGTPLRVAETVTASSTHLTGEELDWFAPGSFAELSDAEALTRRSFERLPSGVRLAAGEDERADGMDHQVDVLEFRLPAATPPPPDPRPGLVAPNWLIEAAQVREGRADGRLAARAFETTHERWRVVGADGRTLATTGESQAHQLARSIGRGTVALPVGDQVVLTDV